MAIYGLAYVWVYVNNPKLNMLVSQKKWRDLDVLFVKLQITSMATFFLGATTVYGILYFWHGKLKFLDRFLSAEGFLLLAFAWLLQLLLAISATYLRAHKQEPLVIVTVTIACFTAISSFLCANYLDNSEYISLGFLSSFVFSIPWISVIFYNKRIQWHSQMN